MEVFFDQEILENFINGLGYWGWIVFFLLQVAQVIIAPIPGNLLTLVGGALFGLWPGFLIAYAANIVGSLIGFSIARKAGRILMAKILGVEKFNKYMAIIGTESAASRTKILLILVLLLPFLPSDLMCMIVGVTPISFRSFFIIVITCRPWGQFAAALLGVGSLHLPLEILIPLVAVIIAVCVLAVFFAPKLERFVFKWTHKLSGIFSKRKEEKE